MMWAKRIGHELYGFFRRNQETPVRIILHGSHFDSWDEFLRRVEGARDLDGKYRGILAEGCVFKNVPYHRSLSELLNNFEDCSFIENYFVQEGHST